MRFVEKFSGATLCRRGPGKKNPRRCVSAGEEKAISALKRYLSSFFTFSR